MCKTSTVLCQKHSRNLFLYFRPDNGNNVASSLVLNVLLDRQFLGVFQWCLKLVRVAKGGCICASSNFCTCKDSLHLIATAVLLKTFTIF